MSWQNIDIMDISDINKVFNGQLLGEFGDYLEISVKGTQRRHKGDRMAINGSNDS